MRNLLALLLFLLAIKVDANIDARTYIPPKAFKVLPIVEDRMKVIWPQMHDPAYMMALIEQESCITLTHKRCFDPTSSLKTSREEGAGLGQLTKAYSKDGSVRFDSLTDMVARHNDFLSGLNWANVYKRPDLQVSAMILQTKDNFQYLTKIDDVKERMFFVDSSYNQGLGNTKKDRMLCGFKKNCDPKIWFGNTEQVKRVGLKPIYGNRTAWDINREHVVNTHVVRKPKYEKFFNYEQWSEE